MPLFNLDSSDVHVFFCDRDLHISQIQSTKQWVDSLPLGQNCVVDFVETKEIDSSGLQFLVYLFRHLSRNYAEITYINLPVSGLQIKNLYGINEFDSILVHSLSAD